jgi:hypothetical protein
VPIGTRSKSHLFVYPREDGLGRQKNWPQKKKAKNEEFLFSCPKIFDFHLLYLLYLKKKEFCLFEDQ